MDSIRWKQDKKTSYINSCLHKKRRTPNVKLPSAHSQGYPQHLQKRKNVGNFAIVSIMGRSKRFYVVKLFSYKPKPRI